MPTLIDRYILRQSAWALAAATLTLVALIWLTQSLRFVELVVNRGLSLGVFLRLTSLLIPNFVTVILPITSFVVVQFVYTRLAQDRELTVMRGAGLSPFALARPALMLAASAAVCCFVLDVWIVPASAEAFRDYQFQIRNRAAAFLLQEGVFTAVSDQLTVYVRARLPDGTLQGILVEDDREANRATILAERGRLVQVGGVPRVLLINGTRQEIDRQSGRLDLLNFQEDTIDLADASKSGDQRYRDDSEMSLQELFHPDAGIPPREWPKLAVEGHKRLSHGLTSISFAMIALVAALQGSFRRGGNLVRPILAIAVVVGLIALGLAVSSIATRHPSLIALIWLQAGLPALICAWLLFRPRGLGAPASRRLPPLAIAS